MLQQRIDLRWIGFALGRLHGLADQSVHGFGIACADLFNVFGIGGQHIVDDFFEFAGVADLFEGFGVDEGVDVSAFTVPQGVKDLFGCVVGDAVPQCQDSCRLDRRV